MIAPPQRTRAGTAQAGRGPLPWLTTLARENIIATLLAMIVLVPCITGTNTLNDGGKVAAFEVLGCLLLLLALSQARSNATDFRRALLAGPNLALAGLTALALVSCAYSHSGAYTAMEMMRIGFCSLLYFVIVYQLRGKGHLQTLTDGLLIVAGAVSLIGFFQMGTDLLRVSVDNRLQGTFGSHELLGSFLMLLLPVSLSLGLTDRGDTKRQLFAQSVALMTAACLLMDRGRFAWVGGGVSLVALSLLGLRYCQVGRSVQPGTSYMLSQMRQRKHLVVGPLLILCGALALFLFQSQTTGGLQKWAATIPHTENMGGRLAQWQGTLHMIAARPIFGWGAGSYPVHEARWTGFGDSSTAVLAHGTSHSNIAHNFYLQTAAELGIVGLGLYLAVIVGFFVTGLRALRYMEGGLRKAILIGSIAAMAGQVVDAIGSPAYNFAAVSLFQWVVMGLGMAAAGLGARATQHAPGTSSAETGISAPLMRRLQFGLAGLVALGIMTQIIPTMPAAFAQTCQIGQDSFVVRGRSGQDTGYTLTSGRAISLIALYDTATADGTTFVISGRTDLVDVVDFSPSAPRFDVTRKSSLTNPGSGQVVVTATYTDPTTNKTFVNSFVINLR